MNDTPTGPDSRTPGKERTRSFAAVVGFPLLFIVLSVVVLVFREKLWDVFSGAGQMKEWVLEWGVAAPLVFVGLQIAQVVVFFIPGEVPQIAGGYLFGFWKGVVLSSAGIALGSAFNFWCARWLGVPFVRYLFREEQIERFNRIARSTYAQIGFFLLFLAPGVPKDVLCYVAGLSPMGFAYFMLVSGLGRLPGIIGCVLMGTAVAEKRWALFAVIASVSTLCFVGGLVFRDRIHRQVARMAGSDEA